MRHARSIIFLLSAAALPGQVVFQAGPTSADSPILEATPCANGQWVLMTAALKPAPLQITTPGIAIWDPVTNKVTPAPVTAPAGYDLVQTNNGSAVVDQDMLVCGPNGAVYGGLISMAQETPSTGGAVAQPAAIARLLPPPLQVLLASDGNPVLQIGSSTLTFTNLLGFATGGSLTVAVLNASLLAPVGKIAFADVTQLRPTTDLLAIVDLPPAPLAFYPPCQSAKALWFVRGNSNTRNGTVYQIVGKNVTPVFSVDVPLADATTGSFACNSGGLALADNTGAIEYVDESLNVKKIFQAAGSVHHLGIAEDGTLLFTSNDGAHLVTASGTDSIIVPLASLPMQAQFARIVPAGKSLGLLVQTGGAAPYRFYSIYVAHFPTIPDSISAQTGQSQVTLPCSDCIGKATALFGGNPLPLTAAANGYTFQVPPGLTAGTYFFSVTITGDLGTSTTLNSHLVLGGNALSFGTNVLPDAVLGQPYTATIAPFGGLAPYTWTLAQGVPPPGITFSNGSLAGTPMAIGRYSFTVKLADSSGQTATQQFTINVIQNPAPAFTGGSVVNASSSERTNLVPGEWITIYGSNFATQSLGAPSVPFPLTLAGVQVLINNQPVPLWYASAGQINAFVPTELTGSSATLQVAATIAGGTVLKSASLTLPVTDQSPGLALYNGDTLIVSSHGLIGPSNPLVDGDEVTLYGTGFGATNPAVGTNQAAPANPLARAVADVQMTLGGRAGLVRFAGLSPGSYGLFQINVRVSLPLRSGGAPQPLQGAVSAGDRNVKITTWY